jgi:hypothetical protein
MGSSPTDVVVCVGEYGRICSFESAEDVFEGNLSVIREFFIGSNLGDVRILQVGDKEIDNVTFRKRFIESVFLGTISVKITVEGFAGFLVTSKKPIAISIDGIDGGVMLQKPILEILIKDEFSRGFNPSVVFLPSMVHEEFSHKVDFLVILLNTGETPISIHTVQPLLNCMGVFVGRGSLERVRFATNSMIRAFGFTVIESKFTKETIFGLESDKLFRRRKLWRRRRIVFRGRWPGRVVGCHC